MHTKALISILAAAAALAPSAAGSATSDPRPVDNPWFPLTPGTTLRYSGTDNGVRVVDLFTVTHQSRRIAGVATVAVHDRVLKRGHVAEDTMDWYAQDRAGNVWYYGEATKELDAHGRVTSREGSWLSGVRGARPGIFMPAHPRPGQSFRQEYFKGHAEDHFKIVTLDGKIHVKGASSNHAMRTTEWSPLEPGVLDAKYYVRGIGTVREASVKGGREYLSLTAVTRA
jgi:hypothetical protein